MLTILGASGHVGSKVANQLLQRGEKVRVVGRNAQNLEEFKKAGADLFIGQIGDIGFLTKAFRGSVGAFVMIPPNYQAKSMEAHYLKMSESILEALRQSSVRYVVNLSSVGAELSSGTGPIQFLHAHEERLNRLEDTNICHLRSAFFMENLLSFIPSIRAQRMIQSCLKADLPVPMIATLDIARAVTQRLSSRSFSGHSVQALLGPRDVSMSEVCRLISEVMRQTIGYRQLSDKDCEHGLIQGGVGEDMAHEFVEMYRAFNEGRIGAQELRDPTSTTTTRIEDFVRAFRGLLGEQEIASKEENLPETRTDH